MLKERISGIESRAHQRRFPRKMTQEILGEPGLSQGASGKEDCIASSICEHAFRAGSVDDIPIADYLNRTRHLFALTDIVPICGPRIGLATCPSMHANRDSASLLCDACNLWPHDAVRVPARANLD